MKVAGRTLILIFLFAFAIHEVNANNFLSGSGVSKHQHTGTSLRNGSYQNLQSDITLNNWLYCSAEENSESQKEIPLDIWHSPFAKHLSYLFEGLVGSDSSRPAPNLNSISIITSPVIVPRYILYHSLRIPAA